MWGDGSQTMTTNNGYGEITTIPAYPNRISTDRYGLLVQGSYKLGGVDAPLPMPLK